MSASLLCLWVEEWVAFVVYLLRGKCLYGLSILTFHFILPPPHGLETSILMFQTLRACTLHSVCILFIVVETKQKRYANVT